MATIFEMSPVGDGMEETSEKLQGSYDSVPVLPDLCSRQRVEPSGAFNSASFQRTMTKPTIFFKILTDADIDQRKDERRQKRNRALYEIITLEAARMENEWRRLRRKKIELRERRMREVIFSELNNIWLSGRNLQHPEQVNPYIRGDGGELSEERSLRKRLFYGCFREFIYKNRAKCHSYGKAWFASAARLRYDNKHHRPADAYSCGNPSYVHNVHDSRRSILDTVTWTAEEVRIYYECMVKYNVWPAQYPTGGHKLASSDLPTQFANCSVGPQSGFVLTSFQTPRSNAYRAPDSQRRYDPDDVMKPLCMKKYFGPDLRHNFMPSRASHRTLTNPSAMILKASSPALNKVLIGKSLSSQVPSDRPESGKKLTSAHFVDELLKENVDHDAVCHVLDENDDVDLYDDL